MKKSAIQKFVVATILFASCNNRTPMTKMNDTIDITKRNALVAKYDLMNFANLKEPVFLTIDEFFDGNNDEASIAPNLVKKPKVKEYYDILKRILQNQKIIGAFAEVKDVMIYQNGQLNDNEWFYTDVIYFIGDISKEEIEEATKSLLPDEVQYDTGNGIEKLDNRYKNKKIVSVWWD